MNPRALQWPLRVIVLGFSLGATALAGEAGWDEQKGFYIKDGDFTLETEFWIQGKADYLEEEIEFRGELWDAIGAESTSVDPKWSTTVRRARAVFQGTAYKPWLNYKFEADFGDGEAVIRDAWLAAHLKEGVNFRFGRFRAPFDLFRLFSERHQEFVENPIGTDALSPGRDLGAMYFGSASNRQFNWALAVQNGDGEDASSNGNDGLLLTARLEWQNAGGFDYHATALDRPENWQWTVGVALANNEQGALVGDTPEDDDDSCTPGVDEKCSYEGPGQTGFELFGALRGKRWQVGATVQKWSFDEARFNSDGELDDLSLTYWNVDFGFFLTERWELAARYGQQSSDDDLNFFDPVFPFLPPIVSERTDDEWRIGVTHYFLGNDLKLQVDYGEDSFLFKDRFNADGDLLTGENEGTVRGLRAMLSFFI